MQLRATLLAITVLSVWAGNASAQTACDPATFTESCDGANIKLCDNVTNAAAPVEASLSCADAFGVPNDGACTATPGCTGDCAALTLACEAPTGGRCVGFSVLTNQDAADNDLAGAIMCQGDDSCSLVVEGGAAVDRCVAHVGPACTPTTEAACVGTTVALCLTNSANTLALTSNIAVDCSLFNTTCGDTPCECDEQCGDGGTCTNGVCEGGVFCVFEPETACPTGEGEGEGEGEDNDGRTRDEPEAAPGALCAGFGANVAMPTFAGLALALLGLRRRRR